MQASRASHLLPEFWGLSCTAPMVQISVLLEPHWLINPN